MCREFLRYTEVLSLSREKQELKRFSHVCYATVLSYILHADLKAADY